MTFQVLFEEGIKQTYLILSRFFIVQNLLKSRSLWSQPEEVGFCVWLCPVIIWIQKKWTDLAVYSYLTVHTKTGTKWTNPHSQKQLVQWAVYITAEFYACILKINGGMSHLFWECSQKWFVGTPGRGWRLLVAIVRMPICRIGILKIISVLDFQLYE